MLNAIIDDFVALYESNAKQRSDEEVQAEMQPLT
jgi:hypothetical protein